MKLHRPVNGGGRRRRWNTRRVSMALLALVLVGLIALSTFAYSSGPATTSIGTRGETADRQRPTKGGGEPTSAPGSNGTRFGRTENGESKVWVEKDDFDSKRQLLHVTSDHYSMIYPIITVRDQRDETSEGGKQVKRSSRWHRRFKFSEAMDTFPLWARSEEKDTLEHASIFVSIAAFRDVECVTTVKSLFSGALSHHRIYVGISEELAEGDKRCIDMINPSNNDEEMRSMLWGSKSDIPLFRRSFSWDELMKDRADIRLTSEIVGPMEVGKKDKTHQQKAQTLSVEDNRSQSPDSVSPSTDSAPSGSPSRGTSTDQQSRKVSAGTNESTKTASMLKSNSTTTTTSTANITKVTQTFSASATNSSTMKNASTIAGISMNTTTHTAPAANTTTSTSAPNSTSTTASPVSTGHASKGVGFGIPNGVFLDPTYKEEQLQCIGGVVERVRDEFLLAQWKKDKKTAPVPLRMGRGGLQELPSPALAGCRIISRVTSHNYARGPTFGRYITSLLAFNQDYFMIVDSHSRFSNHWDAKMILRVFQMNTRGILSHYPNGYTPRKPHAEESKTDVMLMCKGVILTNGMPKLGARWTRVKPYPELEAFAAAGYMFGDAQFVLDVPFDPFLPYLFDGEEVIFSARLWTSGWDIYGPSEANVLHNYDRGASPRYFSLMTAYRTSQKIKSERRGLYLLRRAFPWEQVKHLHTSYVPPEQRPIISATESSTSLPLRAHEEYYGIGTVRSLDDYWTFTQLSDKFVHEKDNEGRWAGGEGLCNGGA